MRLTSGPEALRVLLEALASGVRFIDTADVYASDASAIGEGERLVREALEASSSDVDREEVVVATKGGLRREGKAWIPDGRARHLKSACEASLRALGVECIDLYQLHAVDPKVPIETSLRALEALRSEGKIRRVGLSNVRLEELETAREIVPVASVQVALSALDTTSLKNGVAEHCVRSGIQLIAHSPLGGHRGRRVLRKSKALAAVAARRGASLEEAALAWLLALHPLVLPIPGATRLESLRSSLRALELELELAPEDLDEIAREEPAARVLREPRRERAPDPARADGEVVLFIGYPGAGKSTLAKEWVERGYCRLNRDERGGRLSDLVPELDRRLAQGERRVVLDNTYPARASRFDVVETAWRHGVPVRAIRLETSLEDAQVNAVTRMLELEGRLLEPEEIRKSPGAVPPDALFRFRRELEEPRVEEGLASVERRAFVRRPRAGAPGRGVFLELEEVRPERRDALERLVLEGYRLIVLSYEPSVGLGKTTRADVEAGFTRTRERLGLPLEHAYCPHPPGRPLCWCRKPLPGLGVVFIEKHRLDPARSLVVVSSPADRGFAERLGIPAVLPDEVFD